MLDTSETSLCNRNIGGNILEKKLQTHFSFLNMGILVFFDSHISSSALFWLHLFQKKKNAKVAQIKILFASINININISNLKSDKYLTFLNHDESQNKLL